MKLLIVDDQAAIRMLLEELFSDEYDLLFAANGNEAIDIVYKHSPHLVLLDMKIPGMDGVEILRRIKILNPTIEVFMMTAYSGSAMMEEAQKLGVSKFLSKPFDIEELSMQVNTFANQLSPRRIGC